MQNFKDSTFKSFILCLFVFFISSSLTQAQNSNNEYQTFNVTFEGSKNTTKENTKGKTFVIISGTMTNNETGETTQVNIVEEVEGVDENSAAEATEKAEASFWGKVKNFLFGNKKKGDGVKLDENGQGDYRPGGPMPQTGPLSISFSLHNNQGNRASFKLSYKNSKELNSRFLMDFHKQTIKL